MTATTIPRTQQAVVQRHYGAPDVLDVREVQRPTIADDEVLLRVHAAGLDRGAWHLMTGRPYLLRLGFGLRRPRNPIPGREVSGTVVEVGAAATRFRVGDEVFGIGSGTFANYAAAKEIKLARKPANLTFSQAAVAPVSGITALQGLLDVGRMEEGQHVLVIGASGGVGSYAVQLAKAFGAHVTGVCSTAKLELVRSLGADRLIDYTREDFADGEHRYDLILDLAGNPSISHLRRALTPTGTAVIGGGEEGGSLTGGMGRQMLAVALSPFIGQRLTFYITKERAQDLDRLADLLQAGKVKPAVDSVRPLVEVPAAMRSLAAGEVRGKVAISVLADQ